MSVKVRGNKEIANKLKKLEPKVTKKLARRAMRQSLKPTLEEAKREVPEDSGDLKKAIKIRAGRRSRNWINMSVVVDQKNFPDQWYGQLVEFGTSKKAPNPFLRRSYDKTGETVAKNMIEKLKDGILKEAK